MRGREAEVIGEPGAVEVLAVVDGEAPGWGLLGQADRGHAVDGRLEAGAHGPRVGDVVGQVGTVVDAADDQVGLGGEAAEQARRARSRPACRRTGRPGAGRP